MRLVFADTLYWVALLDVRDPWRAAAVRQGKSLGKHRIVTTDAVLVEVMNAFGASGLAMRRTVVAFVRDLLIRPDTDVVAQDRAQFLAAMAFFEKRPDKEYSFTDCVSMLVMRERRLKEVLTNDHHFEQEGFTILLPER